MNPVKRPSELIWIITTEMAKVWIVYSIVKLFFYAKVLIFTSQDAMNNSAIINYVFHFCSLIEQKDKSNGCEVDEKVQSRR